VKREIKGLAEVPAGVPAAAAGSKVHAAAALHAGNRNKLS